VSIGVVTYPDLGEDTRQLMTHADAAMFKAKDLGRNRTHVYRPEDKDLEKMHSRLRWKGKILKALREDRIVPWFQPILDLHDNRVHHYEVLARMQDEDGKILLPGAFIEVAERFGLVGSIDRVIIEKAVATRAELAAEGRNVSFAANLSGKDIGDEELLLFIQDKLRKSGTGGGYMTFEITETATIGDLNRATEFIRSLKGLGCKFSLDDFGVGFTSFTYLKEMDVDFLKIDGSFIRRLHENPKDQALVKAIIEVARGLDIKTIAEFVEDEKTLELLREFGADYAQGYLIGKPAPAVALDEAGGAGSESKDVGAA
jgi:EAL domain-containing protein (putative c-di-GMP-specific phosphodiesterase class I)